MLTQFLADLETFVGFKTCVDLNPGEFTQARAWIKAFYDPARTEFIELDFDGYTNLLIKPKASARPRVLGDGHIEVVYGPEAQFVLERRGEHLFGRGVADMKTQCLTMMTVQRDLIAQGKHNDFWVLFSEDEEIGSAHGAKRVIEYLCSHDMKPQIAFVPDGGADFSYVEKEKGILRFSVTMPGLAAHASRPFLGENAIEKMAEFQRRLQVRFPGPRSEEDWVSSMVVTRIEGGEAENQIPGRCVAGYDARLTEEQDIDEAVALLKDLARPLGAEISIHSADPATYYPRQSPVARRFLDVLHRVSGREPAIVWTNGASNGRFYLAQDARISVLMSNPTGAGAHADGESLEIASIEPYYELVLATAQL